MGFFDSLLGKKKPSKEIDDCQAALESRPNDPNLLKKLGDLYLKANDTTNASDIYIKLGDFYKSKGFYPKSIALYKQAEKIHPNWEKPLERLAELYKVQGFPREAAAQYVKLSEYYEKKGDSDRAMACLQSAAEISPAHADMLKKVETFNVKEAAMNEPMPASNAPEIKPKADFFDLNKELDKEIEELNIDENTQVQGDIDIGTVLNAIKENAPDESKGDALFLYNMGLAYRETGLIDEAIEAFRKVINTGEKLFDSYVMLGICLRDAGRFEESLKSLHDGGIIENLTMSMKIGVLYEVAQTYKAMGDSKKALAIFKEIHKERQDFKNVESEIKKLSDGG
ncbi:MAG TPA: tetratricopeptide repeat protein [Desulfomonilia bacterium]